MKSLLLAATIASLAATSASANDLIDYGQYLAGECTTCHTNNAKTGETGIPPLADISGWDVESFILVMNSFKSGERENAAMVNVAQALDGEQMKALAAYFLSIAPPEPDEETPAAAAPAAATPAKKP